MDRSQMHGEFSVPESAFYESTSIPSSTLLHSRNIELEEVIHPCEKLLPATLSRFSANR